MRVTPPAVMQLCCAIAVATRLQVNQWCGISDAFRLMPAGGRAAVTEIIDAAVAYGFVVLNGPVLQAHSIRLTAAGHRLVSLSPLGDRARNIKFVAAPSRKTHQPRSGWQSR